MLEELATVVKITNHQVWVTSAQQNACGGCRQKAACATHAMSSVLKAKPVPVDNNLALCIGDQVIVAIDESLLLRAAMLLYVLPLVALFVGAGLADSLLAGNPYADLWVAGSAIGSFLLSLGLINKTQHLFMLNYFGRPVVVKKVLATAYECLGD